MKQKGTSKSTFWHFVTAPSPPQQIGVVPLLPILIRHGLYSLVLLQSILSSFGNKTPTYPNSPSWSKDSLPMQMKHSPFFHLRSMASGLKQPTRFPATLHSIANLSRVCWRSWLEVNRISLFAKSWNKMLNFWHLYNFIKRKYYKRHKTYSCWFVLFLLPNHFLRLFLKSFLFTVVQFVPLTFGIPLESPPSPLFPDNILWYFSL